MKFLTLFLALVISTPVLSAECPPSADKTTDNKAVEVPVKKKHKKYKGTVVPSEVKKEEKAVEVPTKKKHKKYEGTKIPPK